MLNRRLSLRGGFGRRQSGVVLMVALIVLIAMTLAGLALVRSVDTANIIAGNMAFQQAAVHSGDAGVEAAISWIENNPGLLNGDQANAGYSAQGLTAAPVRTATQSWDAYWFANWDGRAQPAAPGTADAAGNTVRRVIDRLCATGGAPSQAGVGCVSSPATGVASGGGEEGGELPPSGSSRVYYRITARIQGPRNTVSYVQAVISR